MVLFLAIVDFQNPMLWPVLVGWIITVVLHEFAHGIVAHWGGDYTIRQRGGLSLNPLQYVDPVFSILIPLAILVIGGVPLPGGATYIRSDLLRSRAWDTAVSLAGPAMNFLLFLACIIPLHPSVGWLDAAAPMDDWTTPQKFLGAMAVLQFFAMVLNLAPIPPLDGFRALAPYLPHDLRQQATHPQISMFLFIGYFLLLSRIFPRVFRIFGDVVLWLGFDIEGAEFFRHAFNMALFGSTV
jgi:Zn-dependent protease